MPYMSLCVVMIDPGNLRDQIFPRTGFAPSDGRLLREVCVDGRPWLRSPEGCKQWLVVSAGAPRLGIAQRALRTPRAFDGDLTSKRSRAGGC